jgi:hypothetical protein
MQKHLYGPWLSSDEVAPAISLIDSVLSAGKKALAEAYGAHAQCHVDASDMARLFGLSDDPWLDF